MLTPTKILIPLDGSDYSESVLAKVCEIFKPSNASLILIQVIAPLNFATYRAFPTMAIGWDTQIVEQQWRQQRQSATIAMHKLAHKLTQAGYAVRVELPLGDPVTEIIRCATQRKVELIVMATHGRTGLLRLLLGSVAIGVLRQTNLPILLHHPTPNKAASSLVDPHSHTKTDRPTSAAISSEPEGCYGSAPI